MKSIHETNINRIRQLEHDEIRITKNGKYAIAQCDDLGDYLKKQEVISKELPPVQHKWAYRILQGKNWNRFFEESLDSLLIFYIEKLTIKDVKDSSYETIEDRSVMLGYPPMFMPDERRIVVRCRDFVLTDNKNVLLGYVQLDDKINVESRVHSLYAIKGDLVRVGLSRQSYEKNVQSDPEIPIASIRYLKNHSLVDRL